MSTRTRHPRRRRLGMLALVLVAIVPFAMGPDDKPEKLLLGGVVYDTLIEERDGTDTVVREIVRAGGMPLWQILSDGSAQYLHLDPRGNVVALTESTGTPGASPGDVLERYVYDAHGKPVFQDGTNQDKVDRFGILAAESDFDNDLLWRAMLYDPETGSRGSAPGDDLGGLYVGDDRYYDPDDGRCLTRFLEGDPDRPLAIGRAYHANPYGSGDAPVNAGLGWTPRPARGHKPREIVVVGSKVKEVIKSAGLHSDGSASDKRKQSLYFPESMESGHAHGHLDFLKKTGDPATSPPSTLGYTSDEPQPLCCKEKFVRSKPHLSPDSDHEAIGVPVTPLKCTCFDMPIFCPSCPGGFKLERICVGSCGGGKFDPIATVMNRSG